MIKGQDKQQQPQPNEVIVIQDPNQQQQRGGPIANLMNDLGVDKKMLGKLVMDIAKDEISERIGAVRKKTGHKRSAFEQVVDALHDTYWIPLVWIAGIGLMWLAYKVLVKWLGI